MRLLVHDFAGYAFPVQLSRELAARGHRVLHLSAGGLPGPHWKTQAHASDGPGLEVGKVRLSRHFRKYSPWRRLVTQRQYALDLEGVLERQRPEVVLSGDTPIDVQAHLLRFCRRRGIGFAHWVQDDYSLALDFTLRRKIGAAAGLATLPYRWLDGWVARNSEAVVSISPGFIPRLRHLGARSESLTVIENWAPLDEVPPLPRRNPWSESLGLNGKPVFLYSGSMGLKHRPDLIYLLARALEGRARVVVVSEGVGRHYLANQPQLPNLTLLDFQPYERLPEILAAADVLLATLEADAGAFAVPSKVLTYLCAGRPVLLTAPLQNLAAEVIRRSGGGVVVGPNDAGGWVEAARKLAEDADLRASLGARARQYAEATFDIEKIADRFEAVLIQAAERGFRNSANALRHGAESMAAPR
ncbi:MAG TPA: glycosyltransferase family 4 protein [Terracidiphilus sp.]